MHGSDAKTLFSAARNGRKFACGGLWAELKVFNLAKQVCDAAVVTYRQREPNLEFLDDLLQRGNLEDIIFVISWGFDVANLARKLQQYHVIYQAHSSGYGFRLPANIPIVTVSRNTLGYWGQRSPHSLIYYLPNQISDEFKNLHLDRDIDVLVQARKSSEYLLSSLIPALKKQCNVCVVTSFVDDLPKLFNRSRIYLYDSAEYWAQQGVSEGFGLQPMEAMACGCQVFSSVNGGLSDYLDPGFNCYKIAGYSLEYDVQRILKILQTERDLSVPESLFAEYRTENIIRRLSVILSEVNEFFDAQKMMRSTIPDLTLLRITQLNFKRLTQKIQQRFLKRKP